MTLDHEDSSLAPIAQSAVEGPLELVSVLCGSTSCPTIYKSGQGKLVVQGYSVSAKNVGVDLPDGELLVEIPAELLAEAARLLS